jgi:hypothetical protein
MSANIVTSPVLEILKICSLGKGANVKVKLKVSPVFGSNW